MKKLTIISLMLLYGLSSLGMSITIHYCMNNMVGWELFGKASFSSCRTCGMKAERHKGYCHDETKIIKTQKDQKNCEQTFSFFKTATITTTKTYSVCPINYLLNTSNKNLFSNI